MRKVSRFWARAAILLTGLGVASIPITMFGSTLVFFYIGTIGIGAGLAIKYFILRCSNCGWGGMIPRWSKQETSYCPKCGKVPEYDR